MAESRDIINKKIKIHFIKLIEILLNLKIEKKISILKIKLHFMQCSV